MESIVEIINKRIINIFLIPILILSCSRFNEKKEYDILKILDKKTINLDEYNYIINYINDNRLSYNDYIKLLKSVKNLKFSVTENDGNNSYKFVKYKANMIVEFKIELKVERKLIDLGTDIFLNGNYIFIVYFRNIDFIHCGFSD